MPYKYDVFISYRRAYDWPRFVDGTFMPMLRRELSDALGRPAQIFHDRRLQTGAAWPEELAVALADSRIMISLLSRQYFGSEWCKAELSQMLARRKAVGGCPLAPLIIGGVIHDAGKLPGELDSIQRFSLERYASPDLTERGPRWEELSFAIRELARHAGEAIERVPPHDPGWRSLAVSEFKAVLADAHHQHTGPGHEG